MGAHTNVRVGVRVTVWVRARIAIFLFVRQHINKLCHLSFLNKLYNENYFNNGFVQLQGISYY